MNGQRDMAMGALVSAAIHALAGAALWSASSAAAGGSQRGLLPLLQQGRSALELTIACSAPVEPVVEPAVFTDPASAAAVVSSEPETPRQAHASPADEAEREDAPPIEPAPPEIPPVAELRGVEGSLLPQSGVSIPYPIGSRIRGEEGTVSIRLRVNADGRVIRAEVVESSGYPALDASALKAMRKTRFLSAGKKSILEEEELTQAVRFRLDEW